jgi:hypothetical protein
MAHPEHRTSLREYGAIGILSVAFETHSLDRAKTAILKLIADQ